MTRLLYLGRFFFVVPPMPLLLIGTFIVVSVAAVVIMAIEPSLAAGALTPILLLQMFACSSGFDVPARRGHYDLLFTRGESRFRVAVAHWMASSLPGAASWAAVAGAHVLLTWGQAFPSLFGLGTVAALVLVSTIPWATTVRLPRFSGAIGWLLIVAMLALVVPGQFPGDISVDGDGWRPWLQSAFAVLAYPPLLVGRDLQGSERLVVLPGLVLATVALIVGFWSVGHRDIPLETAQ
jgi:hypothetical protein